MTDNNKNPNDKQPGEKPAGTDPYNPGNQAGKGAVHREGDEADNTKAAENREKRT
jgi:hypothetical protein